MQINTTDQEQGQIPAGPYFNIHLEGSAGLLKSIPAVSAFDLSGSFDATIQEEGFSVDASGHLDVEIDLKTLLPDPLQPLVDAANLFGSLFDPPIVFDPLTFAGDVAAHLAEIDGRMEGSIGTAPGDDGFQDGDFQVALSRWGCMQLKFYNDETRGIRAVPSPSRANLLVRRLRPARLCR